MQVNEIIHLSDESKEKENQQWLETNQWVNRHPHVNDQNRNSNTLYMASETLTLPNNKVVSGYGTFKYHPSLLLTKEGQSSVCTWKLPIGLAPTSGTSMTYHDNPELWSPINETHVQLEAMKRGQEFIFDGPNAEEWGKKLIETNVCKEAVGV